MRDDSEHEHARVADEARRRAREAEAHTRAEVDRIAAEAQTGEMRGEELRQTGVIYGGLIAVAVVMVQGFLGASSLDASASIGIVGGFWHITWVAGLTFLVAGLVAVGVHSAGFWRVESPRPPATTA